MNNMTTGSPEHLIIRFTIPILLGNLLQLTYTIADTRIVGTYLGDTALAAVGSTTILCFLCNGFMNGISHGFAIILAQFFGADKKDEMKSVFAASLIMGIIISLSISVMTLGFSNQILTFLNVPEELKTVAMSYVRIILMGLVIAMIYNVMLSSARAIGDSFTPLLTLVVSVGLNILGDLLFMGVLKTGVYGAAIATVGSQCITLLICTAYLVQRYEIFRINHNDVKRISKDMVRSMILTGLSMGFMNSMINIGSLILQTAINELGNSYIVAQTAARRLTEILMSVFVAVGQTLATYSGQNYGAGKYKRIREGMKIGYKYTCLWCIAVLIIVYLASPFLIKGITGSNDQIMIQAATKYLKIDSILYVLVAIIFVLRNSLQGIGDRVTPLVSSGIEMVGKILLTMTLVPMLGYQGVILVEPIVWVIMVIPLIIQMRIWIKNNVK